MFPSVCWSIGFHYPVITRTAPNKELPFFFFFFPGATLPHLGCLPQTRPQTGLKKPVCGLSTPPSCRAAPAAPASPPGCGAPPRRSPHAAHPRLPRKQREGLLYPTPVPRSRGWEMSRLKAKVCVQRENISPLSGSCAPPPPEPAAGGAAPAVPHLGTAGCASRTLPAWLGSAPSLHRFQPAVDLVPCVQQHEFTGADA